jgi:membrane-anchored mycosin MYCP
MRRVIGVTFVLVVIGLGFGTRLPAQAPAPTEKILVRAARPYGAVVDRIRSLGGTVTNQYQYIDAVAAEVPVAALTELRDVVGVGAISKDAIVDLPGSVDTLRGRTLPSAVDTSELTYDTVAGLSADEVSALAAATPQGYLLNSAIANVAPLHASGIRGQGVIVAVIDSGIRPGFPHISLDGSVIGCEDFVGDALGCTNAGNNFHGTFVAGMISANVVFTFPANNPIRNAVLAECPACFTNPPVNTLIPMIGTAPSSSLYALRVFGATGGAPTSRILTAMERAIALREAYNANHAQGANIGVVNMSLGGSTVFAGRDLFDRMTDAFLDHDIVVVTSAGNAGQASLTVGSPGTSLGTLTVGAASLAHNERILRRLQFGPVNGALYRPFLGAQTAYFSSRGPNADGRPDPDVVASGFASFGQGSGTAGNITIGSGTSFAAPSTAGLAALLRQAFPGATARQVRNAIVAGANPNFLADGSTVLDQGAGYVDGVAAAALLSSGTVPDALPDPERYTKNVNVNIQQQTALRVRNGALTESTGTLLPGQRHELVYRVAPNTRQIVVMLSGVAPSLPPPQQNQLFGDDILLSVHSAKTSAIGEGDYKVLEFTKGGTFTINDPEPGLIRVTASGDWTNAGTIAADVSIFSTTDPIPQFSTQGQVADQQMIVLPFEVPSGTARADIRLGWREDWGRYPSADVDLILVAPGGAANLTGATVSNPEVVGIDKPAAGMWTAIVLGSDVPTGWDKFELRVSLDGNVLKIK